MRVATPCGYNVELQLICWRKRWEFRIKTKTWAFTMSNWQTWFKSGVDNLNPSPTETTHLWKSISLLFIKSCQYVSSEICSCKATVGCIKDSPLRGNASTFSPMRQIWTVFPNLFLFSSQMPTSDATLWDGEMQGLKHRSSAFLPPQQKSMYIFNLLL